MNGAHRPTMEDAHAAVDCFGGDPRTAFFGVYDGHGGKNVARFLGSHLHDRVEAELRRKGDRPAEECIKAAFLLTDIECAKTGEEASGSTAVVCVVRASAESGKRYVFTANCGDARAVLAHGSRAVRLSKDHKATDPEEVMRIRRAGGMVGGDRVMGVLAVSRSFGDYALKRFVTCDPYTSTTKVNAESEFLIIACDGVWDVLSDAEAVAAVRRVVPQRPPAARAAARRRAAKALVDLSLARGSRDNVTAIVVFLQ